MGVFMDYWEPYKWDLEKAPSVEHLIDVVRGILRDIRKHDCRPIIQIIGPSIVEGRDDFGANMKRSKKAITIAEKHNVLVFNQIKLWNAMNRIVATQNKWRNSRDYYWDVAMELQQGILSSGRIDSGLLLPDWEISNRSVLEHQVFMLSHVPVDDYPKEWLALL
jgi:hypothetical protein